MTRQKAVFERYLKLTASVYDSPAFRTLPPSALKLWIDLRVQFRGGNNGNISAALTQLRSRGWSSDDTLSRALWVLLERGLLRRTREGKPGPFRLCSLYAFTDLPTARNDRLEIEGRDPTREFAGWVPGKSYAPQSKARKMPKKKSLLQNAEQHCSRERNDTATGIGELAASCVPEMEAVIPLHQLPETAPVLARGQSSQ